MTSKVRVKVRITKEHKFRATIQEYIPASKTIQEKIVEQTEVTVGGANWYNTSTRKYHTIILHKCAILIGKLNSQLQDLT